jgi:site-specific DNA-cytosine methylase
MKILSLFDWISCWYVALERAWIKIDKYYASEIDKYAIQVAMKNHPDIIQVGDVTQLRGGGLSRYRYDYMRKSLPMI